MVNDTVGDMITRLRNATFIKTPTVLIPQTRINVCIAEILKNENFIESFQEAEGSAFIKIQLKYKGKKGVPYLTRLTRISKPGLRVYVNKNEIPRVLGGIGIAIISTSQGVMTDREARKRSIGGEVLCHIW